jgi:hypothetical protein
MFDIVDCLKEGTLRGVLLFYKYEL